MPRDFQRTEYSFKGGQFASDISGARSVLTGLAISLMDSGWSLFNTWNDSLDDDGLSAYVFLKHSSGMKMCLALNVSSVKERFSDQCLPADTGTDECGSEHNGQYAGGLMCSVIPVTSSETFAFRYDKDTGKCIGIEKPYQSTPFVGTVGARNRFVKSFLDVNRDDEWYSYIIVTDGYAVFGFSHKISDGERLRGFACGSLIGDLMYADRDTSYCARYMALRLSLDMDENAAVIDDCGIGAQNGAMAFPLHTKHGVASGACMTANYNVSRWVPCYLHIDTHYLSLSTYVPSVLGKDRFARVAVFTGYSEAEADPYRFRVLFGDTMKGYLDTGYFILTSPDVRPVGTLYSSGKMMHIGGGVLIGYGDGGELIPVHS